MKNCTVFAGLDYHQDMIQVCLINRDGDVLTNKRCLNDTEAVVADLRQSGNVKGIAIESCCGAAALADQLATEHGFNVDLAHPGYVSRMRLNPDKTDFSDARLLADLERVGYLPTVWLAPPFVRDLRRLVRHRQALVDEQRNAKLRIRGMLRDQRVSSPVGLRPWTLSWKHWLTTVAVKALSEDGAWIVLREVRSLDRLRLEIKEVENRLAQKTSSDPVVTALIEQPGIGPVTAWTMRAEIGRFDRFRNGKQLARFCGLSPRNASSGTRQADAGLVPAANRRLRACLIEAAHSLMRHHPKWREMSKRMRSAGKPYCLVAAAIGNRWIRKLFHEMKQIAV